MGIGARIFIVHDDDSLVRLSIRRFERLGRRNAEECFPQYAGKRVRYALVILEMTNRKPQEVIKIDYGYLHFDSEGFFDLDEEEKAARLGLAMVSPIGIGRGPEQVVDARHRLSKKRYHQEYTWERSEELEAQIVQRIFGRQRR